MTVMGLSGCFELWNVLILQVLMEAWIQLLYLRVTSLTRRGALKSADVRASPFTLLSSTDSTIITLPGGSCGKCRIHTVSAQREKH